MSPRPPEVIAKISAALRGPRNPGWKGDAAGANAIHRWLQRNWPKAGRCEECDAEGPTDWAFQRAPEPYTRERDDYREWCRSCHLRIDAADRQWIRLGMRPLRMRRKTQGNQR